MGGKESKPQSDDTLERSTPTPWIEPPPWNDETMMELKQRVEAHTPPNDIPHTRILITGPMSAGKSSFINTVNSIMLGKVTKCAIAANRPFTTTNKFRRHVFRTSSSQPLNFYLLDTCGLEDDEGLDVVDLNYMLQGNIPPEYEFSHRVPITPKSKGFILDPKLDQKIHCVVFIFDANKLEMTTTNVWDKAKQLKAYMDASEIPGVILLTKIDQISKQVANDVTTVYHSTEMETAVKYASSKICCEINDVFPIKNYVRDLVLDKNMNILVLHALDRILSDSNNFILRK